MNRNVVLTNVEIIDNLIEVVKKVEDTLIAVKQFIGNHNVMIADGGDPFDISDIVEDASNPVDVTEVRSTPVDEWSKECGEDFTKEVDKKERVKSARRTRVTSVKTDRILDALKNRDPRPRMVDIANEFGVSQATVSRLWRIYQEKTKELHDRYGTSKTAESSLPKEVSQEDDKERPVQDKQLIYGVLERPRVPLLGQMSLPVISEGRKPSLED